MFNVNKSTNNFQKYLTQYKKELKTAKENDIEYCEYTYILDILYGLGLSINEDKYEFERGFDLFKKHLIDVLNK